MPPILSDLCCVGWGDGPEFASACDMIHKALIGFGNRRVFIVHGHDEARVLELKAMLTERKIEPIVLWEQDDRGELEIPSDMLGVVYREFKDRLSEIRGEIETRLGNAGLLA